MTNRIMRWFASRPVHIIDILVLYEEEVYYGINLTRFLSMKYYIHANGISSNHTKYHLKIEKTVETNGKL